MPGHWLSADEIAANLGVNLDTIYEWIGQRNLPAPKSNCPFPFEAGCVMRCLVEMVAHKLAPDGMANFVAANCSLSSNQSFACPAQTAMKGPKTKLRSRPRQRDIRRSIIEVDLVDCMVDTLSPIVAAELTEGTC